MINLFDEVKVRGSDLTGTVVEVYDDAVTIDPDDNLTYGDVVDVKKKDLLVLKPNK